MTERLVTDSEAARWAKAREDRIATHYEGCEEGHYGCQLALYESTRSALIEALEAMVGTWNELTEAEVEARKLLARLHGEGEDR